MPFYSIDIEGHSGCKINISERDGQLLLTKSCTDPGYSPRLAKQAEKQKQFLLQGFDKVRTPKIHDMDQNSKGCSVRMDYVHSLNFVEFFDTAGFEKIHQFAAQLTEFIDWEIEQSILERIPKELFIEKFRDVKQRISLTHKENADILSLVRQSEEVFQLIDGIYIPVGQSHGDLTLSNILFNNDRIFVVDFLDSFIESPLLDMVKLRQDTALGWSYLMYGKPYDKVRHRITLEWLDRLLENHFSSYEWYNENYKDFQLLNLLRILQYARLPKVLAFLRSAITKLLDQYEL